MNKSFQWLKIFESKHGKGSILLFGSRFLTHAVFWALYYVSFSLVWAHHSTGLFASFYLEFILMPLRILAAYGVMYWLIPKYLEHKRYVAFLLAYCVLISTSGLLQMLISYFFYENLLGTSSHSFTLSFAGWARASMLINTTAILLGSIKVFHMYVVVKDKLDAVNTNDNASHAPFLTVKSDRRMHQIAIHKIKYLESMGNYVTYHMDDNSKKVVYCSLKEAQAQLPESFIRIHRSYLINKAKLTSFTSDNVYIDQQEIPRGKEIKDEELSQ